MKEYIEAFKIRRAKKNKEREALKKVYESLSFSERVALNKLKEDKETRITGEFGLPLNILFWGSIYGLFFSYMLGISFDYVKDLFLILLRPMILATIAIFFAGLIVDTISGLMSKRYFRKQLMKLKHKTKR